METPWPEDMYSQELEDVVNQLTNDVREELLIFRYGKEVIDHFKEIKMAPLDPHTQTDIKNHLKRFI